MLWLVIGMAMELIRQVCLIPIPVIWQLTNGFNGQNVNNNTPPVNFTFNFGLNGAISRSPETGMAMESIPLACSEPANSSWLSE